jgi:hypothetical protein
MTTAVMAPDERALRDHLRGGRFLSGVADGRWRLISVECPIVTVAISTAVRENSPTEFVLRLDVDGYPNAAPTGGLWDIDADISLPAERRPRGERVAHVFRTDGWTGGATAMYAPWDRIALGSHQWAGAYPHQEWNPGRDLSFILANVHEMFNADDYLGV